MKKLILFLFAIAMLSFVSNAATPTYQAPCKVLGFGTAADTLVASATKTYEFNMLSDYSGTGNILLFSDSVSGTAAYSAVLSGSIDGLLYVPIDTISHSGGGDKLAYFSTFTLIYNRYKVTITATSAAQKSRLYLYGVIRY